MMLEVDQTEWHRLKVAGGTIIKTVSGEKFMVFGEILVRKYTRANEEESEE